MIKSVKKAKILNEFMQPILILNNFKNSYGKNRWKMIGKLFGYLIAALALAVAMIFVFIAKDLPSPDKINKRVVIESTKIFDRTGEHLLYEIHGEEKRTLIPFAEMPENVRYATLILEDQDFYSHHGIRPTSIVRAALKDIIKGGAVQGGSTITQQFVKNSILTNERTLTRKVKEVILAVEMELKFSKDEILQMYLNEIPYGSNAYGIEAAAQTFFAKRARELTLDEAAVLASLPKAPSLYSPFGSYPERVKARQEYALDQMAKAGYITKEQAEEAKNTDVFAKLSAKKENIFAPHFVMYVKEQLEAKYGAQAMEEGGLRVYTTLDWDKQQVAEKVVSEGAQSNAKKYKAENAALVAMDPKTSQILAMVGSRDYFDTTIDGQVNVAIRDRQPGSSFKPYVYLTAFTKGYTPETLLFDVETQFDTETGKEYKPQNYDGKFHGPLMMKEALGMSLNIPAVKTLYLAGVKDAVTLAKRMGVTTLNQPERYGLSLVLGGGEVKLVDHVNAFGTLATGGIYRPKTAILRVEDNQGKKLEEYKEILGERVVEEKYVAMLDHIISTNSYRAPVFGENSPLKFENRQVAAKTGTTNEWRDGWTMGYTPSIAVGVWAGNNDNSPMAEAADGVFVAAPIWRKFMDAALVNSNTENFPKYEKEEDLDKPVLKGEMDVKKNIKVCEIPGKNKKYCLANKYCPNDDVKEKDFANAHTILWYVKKDDPRGPAPEDPKSDPQFENWEKGVEKWFEKDKNKKYISSEPPKDDCKEGDFGKFKPSVSLAVSASGNQISASANANAPYGVDSMRFKADGSEFGAGAAATYTVPPEKNNSSIEIRVEMTDKNGNTASESKSVNVSF